MEPIKDYYENGRLSAEGFISGELQVGAWIFYHENGNIFSKGQFDEAGKVTGIWTEYYTNGQIRCEYINIGTTSWEPVTDPDLQILNYWSEGGIPQITEGEGKLVLYYDNGNIENISNWKNQLKDGLYQGFHKNGTLASERNYENGIPVGEWQSWSDTSELIGEGYYKEGKQNGYLIRISEDKSRLEYIIKEDKFIPKSFMDKTGKLLMQNGTGICIDKYTFTEYHNYYENYVFIKSEKVTTGYFLGFKSEQPSE